MEIITRTIAEWPEDGPVEVVERKGLGHPDTVCDAIAERVCRALCLAYRERFGVVLHHNVDKVLLCGGTSRPRFGGGEIVAPIKIFLGGRATTEWKGATVPVDDLAIAACREVLAERLPFHREIQVFSCIRPGSFALARLFSRDNVPIANDTSCGVGFAPFTELERIVYEVEHTLNDPSTKASHPELGNDVKVMGIRRRDMVQLTVACAFIDKYVESIDAYVAKKAGAERKVQDAVAETSHMHAITVLNAGDDIRANDIYLTVTGCSAEAGDDGQVGRGNRVTGLITPYRPMTLEAAAGKNPINHVGKLYSVVAARIARGVVTECHDVTAASCVLVSQIGAPLDEPSVIDIAIPILANERIRTQLAYIAHDELSRIPRLTDELLAGTLSVV